MQSRTVGSFARRGVRAALVAGVLVTTTTCSDQQPVAPPTTTAPARLVIRPSLQRASLGGPAIDLAFVDAVLTAPGQDALRAGAEFRGDSVLLALVVPSAGASTAYTLDVTAYDAASQPAFHFAGTVTLKSGETLTVSPELAYSAPDATVASLRVSPAMVSLDAGGSMPLAVNGTTAANAPVSAIRVAWIARNTKLATVDASGVVRAGALQGSTYVVARTYTNVADSALVRVKGTVAKITVAPSALTVARGVAGAVGAELRDAAGTLIDDRTVAWTSSNPAVATVSALGVIQGVANGTATITATIEGKTGAAAVTVVSPVDHVEISPSNLMFSSLDETQSVTAREVPVPNAVVTGIPVTFSSSDASVATVTATGVVTARGNGTTTIIASADGRTATVNVTVRQVAVSLSIDPAQAGVTSLGDSRSLTATALDARGNPFTSGIMWSSSNGSIASVRDGVVTGVSIGTATIAAAAGDQRATAAFTVAQVPVSMALLADRSTIQIGSTAQLRVNITDANGHPLAGAVASYESQATRIAQVSPTGSVLGMGLGDATIVGRSGTLSASTVIHVGGIGNRGVRGRVVDGLTGVPVSGASVWSSAGPSTTTYDDGTFYLPAAPAGSFIDFHSPISRSRSTYYDLPAPGSGIIDLGDVPITFSLWGTDVAGRVLTASGDSLVPVPGAVVTARYGIHRLTGNADESRVVAPDGSFRMPLDGAVYTLLATAPGYVSNWRTTVVPGCCSLLSNQDIILVRAAP